jgi:acetyl-CoA C-acetyltransferase
MINDGLWCSFEDWHMGNAGEVVAECYHVGRAAQDEYAAESHRRAAKATADGAFADEMLPISIPQKKGDPLIVNRDEAIRADTTVEALAALKPAFKKDGTVTAGNAPGTNDGAAALIVTSERNASRLGKQPIARIVAQAVSGVEPKWVMMAPVDAVEKLLTKTGWNRDKDVDLVELNEAFAVAAIAVTRQLKLNPEKVNVNGGAVALGHPIGASGARILVTLLYELQRRNLKRGIAALCLGGGNAVALAVERY